MFFVRQAAGLEVYVHNVSRLKLLRENKNSGMAQKVLNRLKGISDSVINYVKARCFSFSPHGLFHPPYTLEMSVMGVLSRHGRRPAYLKGIQEKQLRADFLPYAAIPAPAGLGDHAFESSRASSSFERTCDNKAHV